MREETEAEHCPRQNDRMLNESTKTFEKALYSNDAGMWTVFEITKRPIAKVPSESMANNLIENLQIADTAKKSNSRK